MNTTLITIFILEIIILGLILYCVIGLNLAVNRLNKKVLAKKVWLKSTLPAAREIFTLTHQYIEMWKEDFAKKIEPQEIFLANTLHITLFTNCSESSMNNLKKALISQNFLVVLVKLEKT